MSDSRVVYGARCSWWDTIDSIATTASGLPCCPRCYGPLFETDSLETWFRDARRYETDGHPGYVAFLEWLRGKCFLGGLEQARAEYDVQIAGIPPLRDAVLKVRVPMQIDEAMLLLAGRSGEASNAERAILEAIAGALPSYIRLDVEVESLDARLAVTIEDR